MDDKLPVIYLTIDDNEEAGVEAVALVDTPAIERNWMAFSAITVGQRICNRGGKREFETSFS